LAVDGAEDAAYLPVTEDLRSDTATTGPLFALANWQFVDVSELEDLGSIETCSGTV